LKFKLSIASGLFPTDTKYITQLQHDFAYPEDFCYNKNNVENYFFEIINKIKVNELLGNWQLEVRITLGGALYDNCIGINKRGIIYIKDKCKCVYIDISLPCNDEINWGIDKKRRFPINSIKNGINKIILVDYSKYKNMSEYIENNIKFSIMELFSDGITLKKYKIKL